MNNVLNDSVCDKLSKAAKEKADELNLAISFAIYDEHGLPLLFRRYDGAPAISTKLAPGKAYTSAMMSMPTHQLAKLCCDGGPLMGLENKDSKITLVGGGYPLLNRNRCIGGIGIGGGRGNEDNIIAEHVLEVFEKLCE